MQLFSLGFWTYLSAASGALYAAWKVLRLFRPWYRSVKSWLVRQDESAALVRLHLTRNGGSSLLDKIHRLEHQAAARAEREFLFHEDSDMGLFICKPDGTFERANRTYYRMVGRLPEEVQGHGWTNIVDPGMRELAIDLWNRAIEEAREFDEHLIYLRPDGERVPVRVRAKPVRVNGEIMEWVGVVRRVPGGPRTAPIPPGCPLNSDLEPAG